MTQSNSGKSFGNTKKKPRGFALLKINNPDKFREIVQQGGWAVQEKGTGHRWSDEEQKKAVIKSIEVRKERGIVKKRRDRSNSNES